MLVLLRSRRCYWTGEPLAIIVENVRFVLSSLFAEGNCIHFCSKVV